MKEIVKQKAIDTLFINREDFIFLGTNMGYLKWYEKTIVMKDQKGDSVSSDLILKGHAHFFSYPEVKTILRLPTLSDNHPIKVSNRYGLPGFLVCEKEVNNYWFDYYVFYDGDLKRVLKRQTLFHKSSKRCFINLDKSLFFGYSNESRKGVRK